MNVKSRHSCVTKTDAEWARVMWSCNVCCFCAPYDVEIDVAVIIYARLHKCKRKRKNKLTWQGWDCDTQALEHSFWLEPWHSRIPHLKSVENLGDSEKEVFPVEAEEVKNSYKESLPVSDTLVMIKWSMSGVLLGGPNDTLNIDHLIMTTWSPWPARLKAMQTQEETPPTNYSLCLLQT